MFNKDLYEKFKDHIILPDDFTDCPWYEEHGTLSWSEEGIVDLMNDGECTYNAEVCGRRVEKDGHLLVILYNGCGETYQAIFDLSKKVDVDKYWEEQEEGND